MKHSEKWEGGEDMPPTLPKKELWAEEQVSRQWESIASEM